MTEAASCAVNLLTMPLYSAAFIAGTSFVPQPCGTEIGVADASLLLPLPLAGSSAEAEAEIEHERECYHLSQVA